MTKRIDEVEVTTAESPEAVTSAASKTDSEQGRPPIGSAATDALPAAELVRPSLSVHEQDESWFVARLACLHAPRSTGSVILNADGEKLARLWQAVERLRRH